MKKVSSIKLYNPVKLGSDTITFISATSPYEVYMQDHLIAIKNAKGDKVYTSLYNTAYWTFEEETHESKSTTSSTTGRRTKKKQ